MKNSGKILRIGFWLCLGIVVLVGYLKIARTSDADHLVYVPAEASDVVIIDQRRIGKKFIELVRYTPSVLEEIIPDDIQEGERPDLPSLGIDPYAKFVFFRSRIDQQVLFGSVLRGNASQLYAFFEKSYPNGIEDVYTSTDARIQVKRVQNDFQDVTIALNKEVAIYFMAPGHIEEGFYTAKVLPLIKKAIENKEEGLIAVNTSFKEASERVEDIVVWNKGGNGMFSGFIESTTTNVSFDKGHLMFTSDYQFADQHPFKEGVGKAIAVNQPVSISLRLNESGRDKFIANSIPEKLQPYLEGFTGDLLFEMAGYQMIQGYEVVSEFDPETFEEIEIKTPKAKKEAFPKFHGAVSVDQPQAYLDSLIAKGLMESDSLHIWFDLVDEVPVYARADESRGCIVFANNEDLFDEFDRNHETDLFSTYGIQLNFIEVGNELPASISIGALNGTLLSFGLGMLEFEEVHFDLATASGNTAQTSGQLRFKDQHSHALVSLLRMVKQGYNNKNFLEIAIQGWMEEGTKR